MDPVVADEIRHDQETQRATERLLKQLAAELRPRIRGEVVDGEHDEDLCEWLGTDLVTRVARRAALQMEPDADDLRTMALSIEDYVQDAADRRALRQL